MEVTGVLLLVVVLVEGGFEGVPLIQAAIRSAILQEVFTGCCSCSGEGDNDGCCSVVDVFFTLDKLCTFSSFHDMGEGFLLLAKWTCGNLVGEVSREWFFLFVILEGEVVVDVVGVFPNDCFRRICCSSYKTFASLSLSAWMAISRAMISFSATFLNFMAEIDNSLVSCSIWLDDLLVFGCCCNCCCCNSNDFCVSRSLSNWSWISLATRSLVLTLFKKTLGSFFFRSEKMVLADRSRSFSIWSSISLAIFSLADTRRNCEFSKLLDGETMSELDFDWVDGANEIVCFVEGFVIDFFCNCAIRLATSLAGDFSSDKEFKLGSFVLFIAEIRSWTETPSIFYINILLIDATLQGWLNKLP